MNLGMPEMIFIVLVALLVFGPRKLPELGRQLGRAMTEFRRASNEFKWQLEEEMRQLEESERASRARRSAAEEEAARSIAPPEGTVSSRSGTPTGAAGAAVPDPEQPPAGMSPSKGADA